MKKKKSKTPKKTTKTISPGVYITTIAQIHFLQILHGTPYYTFMNTLLETSSYLILRLPILESLLLSRRL